MPDIMPNEPNKCLMGKIELYALLEKGLEDVRAGRGEPAEQFFAELMEDLEQNGRLGSPGRRRKILPFARPRKSWVPFRPAHIGDKSNMRFQGILPRPLGIPRFFCGILLTCH